MFLVDDHIFVERHSPTGHYILSAFVTDQFDDFTFSHSIQFYFYDESEIDFMKQVFMDDLKKKGLVLSRDYDFDDVI